MKDFFDQLKFVMEDVWEDVTSAKLDIEGGRAGDFGCGQGLTTLSLMIALGLSDSIGIDKDDKAIEQAQKLINQVKEYLFSVGTENQWQQLSEIEALVYNVLKSGKLEFQVDDVVTNEGFLSDLDLAYCKRILTPIFLGEYGNKIIGEIGVKTAIEKIAKSLKIDGWLIASEKASGIDFLPFFEQAGLGVVSTTRFERGDIGTKGRITLYKSQYVRYVCRKL